MNKPFCISSNKCLFLPTWPGPKINGTKVKGQSILEQVGQSVYVTFIIFFFVTCGEASLGLSHQGSYNH